MIALDVNLKFYGHYLPNFALSLIFNLLNYQICTYKINIYIYIWVDITETLMSALPEFQSTFYKLALAFSIFFFAVKCAGLCCLKIVLLGYVSGVFG